MPFYDHILCRYCGENWDSRAEGTERQTWPPRSRGKAASHVGPVILSPPGANLAEGERERATLKWLKSWIQGDAKSFHCLGLAAIVGVATRTNEPQTTKNQTRTRKCKGDFRGGRGWEDTNSGYRFALRGLEGRGHLTF